VSSRIFDENISMKTKFFVSIVVLLAACSTPHPSRDSKNGNFAWLVLDSEGAHIELDLMGPSFEQFVNDEELARRLKTLTPEGLEAVSERFFRRFPLRGKDLVAYGFRTGLGQDQVSLKPFRFRPSSVDFQITDAGRVVPRLVARNQDGVGIFGVTRLAEIEEPVFGHMDHSFLFTALTAVRRCQESDGILFGFEDLNVLLGRGWCSTLRLGAGDFLHSTEYVRLRDRSEKLVESSVQGHCTASVRFSGGSVVERFPVRCRDRQELGYDQAAPQMRSEANRDVFHFMSEVGAPTGWVSASLPSAAFRSGQNVFVVVNRFRASLRSRCVTALEDLGRPENWRCSKGASLGSW
jgi:hypothetical protein